MFVDKNDALTEPFRVQFWTGTIKPKHLPEFAYVSSTLRFDSIMFTAIIHAVSLKDAVNEITLAWPDAVVQFAQQGVANFQASDTHLGTVMYGAYIEAPKTPWYMKWRFQ